MFNLRWPQKKPHQICTQLAHDLESDKNRATTGASRRKVQELCDFLAKASKEMGNDKEVELILQVVSESNVFLGLVTSMIHWEFEGRKDIVDFFSSCVETRAPTFVEHLCNSELLKILPDAYKEPETALNCGLMFRDALKIEQVGETILEKGYYVPLFTHVRNTSYDLASDAWLSLKDSVMRHKTVSAVYVEQNFDRFFQLYHDLFEPREDETGHYVTLRQSLKLLSDMLLDRTFLQTMLKYVQQEEFLKMHMNLLKNTSKTIQFEAFHIFKIFAANPHKPPRVQRILFQNKDRLLRFFENFLDVQRSDDQQFQQDRATVAAKLEALEAPPSFSKQASMELNL